MRTDYQLLVPHYREATFHHTMLGVDRAADIAWRDIVDIIERFEIDDFSKECLRHLRRF